MTHTYYEPTESGHLVTHAQYVHCNARYFVENPSENTFLLVSEIVAWNTENNVDHVAVYGGVRAGKGSNNNVFGGNFLAQIDIDAGDSATAIGAEFNTNINKDYAWGVAVQAIDGSRMDVINPNNHGFVVSKGTWSPGFKNAFYITEGSFRENLISYNGFTVKKDGSLYMDGGIHFAGDYPSIESSGKNILLKINKYSIMAVTKDGLQFTQDGGKTWNHFYF